MRFRPCSRNTWSKNHYFNLDAVTETVDRDLLRPSGQESAKGIADVLQANVSMSLLKISFRRLVPSIQAPASGNGMAVLGLSTVYALAHVELAI